MSQTKAIPIPDSKDRTIFLRSHIVFFTDFRVRTFNGCYDQNSVKGKLCSNNDNKKKTFYGIKLLNFYLIRLPLRMMDI